MSAVTDSCRTQAKAAWKATGTFRDRHQEWKERRRPRDRTRRGWFGALLSGLHYIAIPLMIFVCVETVLIAWALILTLLWGLTAIIDAMRRPTR
jgi:hypothetical protein